MTTYLENRLQRYEDNYHAGNLIISDTLFDQLENNLMRINPYTAYFPNKKELPFLSLPKDKMSEFNEILIPDKRFKIVRNLER